MNAYKHVGSSTVFRQRAVLMGAIVAVTCLSAAHASQPGDVDLSFDPGSTVNGQVNAIAVQTNGQILIGGTFTTVQGAFRSGLARLNSDGTTDFGYLGGSEGVAFDVSGYGTKGVSALAIQPDGKVLVGGYFYSINGIARTNIARLNADGTVDNTFQNGMSGVHAVVDNNFPSTSAYDGVTKILLQSDGKILIGGYFFEVNGTFCRNVARLNADGSLDGTFGNIFTGGWVSAMALQSDGKILVGGWFAIVDPITSSQLVKSAVRLNSNGTLDTSFQTGLGDPTDGSLQKKITSIALQTDGKILIAGEFNSFNGVARTNLARLNSNGTLDSTFNAGTESRVFSANNEEALSLALDSGGKVLVSGGFNYINGVYHPGFARLNSDGSLDNAFISGGSGLDGYGPVKVVRQSDGKLLLGGNFYFANGSPRNALARINSSGTLDSAFRNAPTGIEPQYPLGPGVESLAVQTNGQILIAGGFQNINGVTNTVLARLNWDGSLETNFQSSINAGVGPIIVRANGKILIGGGFDTVSGTTRNGLAQLNPDGSVDPTFGSNGVTSASSPGSVSTICLQPDGKAVIAGNFDAIEGTPRPGFGRVNVNGTVDPGFANGISGVDGYVGPVALQSDGKVVIGGNFGTVNGSPRRNIARLNSNGTLDTTFQAGLAGATSQYGFSAASVTAIAVQPDGKVIIGGFFDHVNNVARMNIARLNGSNGGLDSTFQNGMAGVVQEAPRAVLLQADGKIVIVGEFISVNDVPRRGIARLNTDGSLDTSFVSDVPADEVVQVFSVAQQPDGNFIVGGIFSGISGVVRPLVARIFANFPQPSLLNVRNSSGQVRFDVNGASGQTVVVEGSSEFQTWTPLQTNTLISSPAPFSESPDLLRRVYRGRLQ